MPYAVARFDFCRRMRRFRRSRVTRLFAASGVGCNEGFGFSRVGCRWIRAKRASRAARALSLLGSSMIADPEMDRVSNPEWMSGMGKTQNSRTKFLALVLLR